MYLPVFMQINYLIIIWTREYSLLIFKTQAMYKGYCSTKMIFEIVALTFENKRKKNLFVNRVEFQGNEPPIHIFTTCKFNQNKFSDHCSVVTAYYRVVGTLTKY